MAAQPFDFDESGERILVVGVDRLLSRAGWMGAGSNICRSRSARGGRCFWNGK